MWQPLANFVLNANLRHSISLPDSRIIKGKFVVPILEAGDLNRAIVLLRSNHANPKEHNLLKTVNNLLS
jgi:hypothetical protein